MNELQSKWRINQHYRKLSLFAHSKNDLTHLCTYFYAPSWKQLEIRTSPEIPRGTRLMSKRCHSVRLNVESLGGADSGAVHWRFVFMCDAHYFPHYCHSKDLSGSEQRDTISVQTLYEAAHTLIRVLIIRQVCVCDQQQISPPEIDPIMQIYKRFWPS